MRSDDVICSRRDIRANDYADLMACANDTSYDPLCIYTHDRNGDRRVDHVDVGVYLAHADSNGLVGPPAGMANYGRPLRLPFDADGDGRIDLFDWYALQTCYDRATTRCNHLFDFDASALVDGPDLEAFRASAEPPYSGPPSKPWRRQLVASRYGNPFMWTGQRYDATTGQYHFWARTYSPRLGRWLQRDPLEYIDGPSQYAYGSPSPVVTTDAFGLWPHDVMSEMIIRRTRTDGEDDETNPPEHTRGQIGTLDEFAQQLLILMEQNPGMSIWQIQKLFINASGSRYIYIQGMGWIDMQHFLASAYLQDLFGRLLAWLGGVFKEIRDGMSESAWRHSDLRGNNLGRQFMRWFRRHYGSGPYTPAVLTMYLKFWLRSGRGDPTPPAHFPKGRPRSAELQEWTETFMLNCAKT